MNALSCVAIHRHLNRDVAPTTVTGPPMVSLTGAKPFAAMAISILPTISWAGPIWGPSGGEPMTRLSAPRLIAP